MSREATSIALSLSLAVFLTLAILSLADLILPFDPRLHHSYSVYRDLHPVELLRSNGFQASI